MVLNVEGGDVLAVAIIVYFVGYYITERIRLLKRYNIPAPVTGGLLCSIAVAVIYFAADCEIVFDMRLRDQALRFHNDPALFIPSLGRIVEGVEEALFFFKDDII